MPIPAPHRRYFGPILPLPENEALVGTISVTADGDVAFAMERVFTRQLTKEQAADLVAAFADYLNREMAE